MKRILVAGLCLLVAGCNRPSGNSTSGDDSDSSVTVADGAGGVGDSSKNPTEPGSGPGMGMTTGPPAAAAPPVPVPIAAGVASLNADNTTIEFVGTHSGDDPNPRAGVFTEFSGQAHVDADAKLLQSVSLDIRTDSLHTSIANLTNHLKSPDFLDAREHPTATFESTSITGGEGGEHTITGNLTLLGTTAEISFPAQVTIAETGLLLTADFVIDRTQWGMTGAQDRVNKEVELKVSVGEETRISDGGRLGGGHGDG